MLDESPRSVEQYILRCTKRHNVRVGNLLGGQVQVGFDRMCQLWNEKLVNFRWKGQGIQQSSLTRGGNVYHAQNEIMNPNHEKKNTRP